MKLSRLLKGHLKEKLVSTGSLSKLEGRCTGDSLGKAFLLIGAAMTNEEMVSATDRNPKELYALVTSLINQHELLHLAITCEGQHVFAKYDIEMSDDEIHRELAGL